MKVVPDGVKGYRRLIPSLTALVEFEAVARLRSFTQAAGELGVTQAAVSRQIRLLEDLLGVRLLDRLHRNTTLTGPGEALYTVVAEAMGKIAGVFDRLSTGVEEEELVLAATAACTQFLLMPGLSRLRRLNPSLSLRLTTTMFTADLRHNAVDALVRWGNGKWDDGASYLLCEEQVFPVCSPAWLEAHGEPATLLELANLDLIGYDPTSEGWLTWEEWFRALGTPPTRLRYGLRTCLYNDAVQAALDGQGVALGWGRLLHDHLAAGKLVRLTGAALPLNEAYYLVVPHGRTVTPTIQTLIELLRGGVAMDVSPAVGASETP